jgi:MutS domain V
MLLAILAWRTPFSLWWLLAPAGVLGVLMHRHERVLRERHAAARGIAFYERGLARIEDRWMGVGEPGDRFRNDGHVYANDLDLFGRGSLFELLSLARTRTGEETLAGWLTAPAGAAEIGPRQEAVAEITGAVDLRERIALAGADVGAAVHTDRLLTWAESFVRASRWLRTCTWLLSAAVLATMLYLLASFDWRPLSAVVVLEALVLGRFRKQVDALSAVGGPAANPQEFVADALTHRVLDLDIVADQLKHLERETFTSTRLATLRQTLTADAVPASRVILRLHRLSEVRDWVANAGIFAGALFLLGEIELALTLAAILQLWRPHIALAVERWRRQHGPHVRVWLQTVGEFEALGSLSAYRYEHPDDPFPELVSEGPVDGGRSNTLFEGLGLGHPLLSSAGMVRNDVQLTGETRLLVVSGSNMSGKSTLLRTVGINAVLALAGAPVRARALRLSPLTIGATLRIQDSLHEGRSRFYAEITRIRELADLARGPLPLLFLLDELFHGTNSHDRLIGSSGVLRGFLNRGAIGLITTHDLALAGIARALAPRGVNVHFEDWYEGGDIRFDYLLKSGPVTRSNALALMRAVGLDVPDVHDATPPSDALQTE